MLDHVGVNVSESSTGFPSTSAAYAPASQFIVRLIDRLEKGSGPLLPKGVRVLNVNFPVPYPSITGVALTHLGAASDLQLPLFDRNVGFPGLGLPGNPALPNCGTLADGQACSVGVGVDLDGLPETIQEVTDHQNQDQFSQEFQLTGKALDDKLDWVAGLYYFQEEGFVHDFVPFGSTLYIYDVANDVDTKSYAAFFHVDYALNDAIGLTVGARYSKDDKKFEGGQADLDGYNYKSVPGCWTATGPDMACWAAFAGAVGLAPFPDPTNPYRYFPPGEQSVRFFSLPATIASE